MIPPPLIIKPIAELSCAALKVKLHKELSLWYELRVINVTHMGKLPREDAVAALVSSFGYSEPTIYRLLEAGKGKFWDIKGSKLSGGFGGRTVIKIRGLEKVAEYLNASGLSRPVEIRASDFRGRQAKTAQLYASFFKPDGSRAKPIARESIEAATGVKRCQQKRYDRVAGIKRVANFAFQQDGMGKLTPIRHLVEGKSQQWLKNRRLGNTYHSQALKAHRGMTKRINAKLHRSLKSDKISCVPKRFFLSAKTLIKCSERHAEAFLLVNKRDRLIEGRTEWCMA